MKIKEINFKKMLLTCISSFFVIVGLLYIFQTASYIIPDSYILDNRQESLDIIAGEEVRWQVITGIEGSKLDTFTDRLLFTRLVNEDNLAPHKAAVWNNSYFRYWMGSMPFLRVLLIFINYTGIRFFNVFWIFGLFMVVIQKISAVLSKTYAGLFTFTLLSIHFWIFPLSLQYTPVYSILMLAILAGIYLYEKGKLSYESAGLLAFITGILTNYFDLLTAPLLTFALPFIVLYSLVYKQDSPPRSVGWISFLITGTTWLAGYAGTWLSKWVLAYLQMGPSALTVVARQITFRTVDDGDGVINLGLALGKNLNTFLPNYVLPLIAGLFLLWLVCWWIKKRPVKGFAQHLILLLVALLPFVWMALLTNHSYHHFYFTYRNLAVTLLGLCSYLYLIASSLSKSSPLEDID